jgi:hypothetical protein
MLPLAAFLSGVWCSFVAYRATHRKAVFLLPLHFIFKTIALWLGFIRSHSDSYGHYYLK